MSADGTLTPEESAALGEALTNVAFLLYEMVRQELERRQQAMARSPFIAAILNANKPPAPSPEGPETGG